MRYGKLIAILFILIITGCESNDATTSMDSAGQGGSTARYTIQGNYLYVVDDRSLRVFNISGNNFVQVSSQELDFGVETIFSRFDYLYLGAVDGMYIYNLTDPEAPGFVFRYQHILACDPVVVQGNRAYVTLSASAEACSRSVNELQIIDITDKYDPRLITRYPMTSPRGLGIDGAYLFVSEGPHGLKVLDISDEFKIKLIQNVTGIHAFDVIAWENRLTVTGQDGIFQYSYPGQGEEIPEGAGEILTLLSKIPVTRQ